MPTEVSEVIQDYSKAIEEACATAIENGLTVIDAKPNQLFVDLDKKPSVVIFTSRVESLVKNGIATDWRITRSKSGNSHGYVTLTKDTPLAERIALQCVLGSDLAHEYLNYMAYTKLGESARVVFFEPKVSEASSNAN